MQLFYTLRSKYFRQKFASQKQHQMDGMDLNLCKVLAAFFIFKMSECLRTYGPQIIRVPQLQIED